MSIETSCIHHCMTCGRVVRTDVDTEEHMCCGQTMVTTCTSTTLDESTTGEGEHCHGDTESPK